MTDLQIFENPEFGQVRTVEIDGQPWLVGKDVAVALGYKNPLDALDRHVDDEDKNTVVNPDGNRGNPNMIIINESGLYSLILSSKMPKAKAFKRWVTSEVLPAIRKNGMYETVKAQQHIEQLEATNNRLSAAIQGVSEAKEQLADVISLPSFNEIMNDVLGEVFTSAPVDASVDRSCAPAGKFIDTQKEG